MKIYRRKWFFIVLALLLALSFQGGNKAIAPLTVTAIGVERGQDEQSSGTWDFLFQIIDADEEKKGSSIYRIRANSTAEAFTGLKVQTGQEVTTDHTEIVLLTGEVLPDAVAILEDLAATEGIRGSTMLAVVPENTRDYLTASAGSYSLTSARLVAFLEESERVGEITCFNLLNFRQHQAAPNAVHPHLPVLTLKTEEEVTEFFISGSEPLL